MEIMKAAPKRTREGQRKEHRNTGRRKKKQTKKKTNEKTGSAVVNAISTARLYSVHTRYIEAKVAAIKGVAS